MKTLRLAIIIMVLLTGHAFGAGDGLFPPLVEKSVSPDGRYEVSCRQADLTNDKSDDTQWYELYLRDGSTGVDEFIQNFIGSVRILWSPDSRHFAVTYWMGGRSSRIKVYPTSGDTIGMNPLDIIRDGFGEFSEMWNKTDCDFEAVRWKDKDALIIHLFSPRGLWVEKKITYLFEVTLSGEARRLQSRKGIYL